MDSRTSEVRTQKTRRSRTVGAAERLYSAVWIKVDGADGLEVLLPTPAKSFMFRARPWLSVFISLLDIAQGLFSVLSAPPLPRS